jgi:hypothetical protein
VDPSGQPWVLNSAHLIYRWAGGWVHTSGAATDISIGGRGAVWVVGTNPLPGGSGVYLWNGGGWTAVAGAGVSIAVAPFGQPSLLDPEHHILAS